jgi:membrane protein DedA with SNARE-associated domain
VIDLRTRRARRVALWLFVLCLLPTFVFGMRTYGSYRVLRSAYAVGAPATSSIRGWMTLGYVATTYHAPLAALIARLGLPPDTAADTSLMTIASRAGVLPHQYVPRVQRAVADFAKANSTAAATAPPKSSGWLASMGDKMLAALLVYGYPVLVLTLLFGALGLPLPNGIATAVAGSLAAQGRMDWPTAASLVVIASVVGDAAAYGIGRLLGREALARHGRWFGYSARRHAMAQSLFDQWGLLTVFITRTFVSNLSSIASLLAGITHYGLPRFLAVALTGRLIWAAAYLGLGAAVGSDLEAASGFLTNLSLLLVTLALLTAAGLIAAGRAPVLVERQPA